MDLDLYAKYPSVAYLERRAKHRMPFFAWEYLASGTGSDDAMDRNRAAIRAVCLTPKFMLGEFKPAIETTLFGESYSAPFGIAPVGLTGLMWPGAERFLAQAAARHRIPFSLSTVATETPETIGQLADGMGWFQLYPPRDPALRQDLLRRAADAGFTTLLVTADVPESSRRERQAHAQVSVPPRRTWQTYLRAAMRPTWSLTTLAHGLPRFRTLERYAQTSNLAQISAFMSEHFNHTLSWDYLKAVREEWPGPVVVKGILHPDDARQAVDIGMQGVLVSNHGGRQFDGAPAAIDALPPIVAAIGGQVPILFDSGVRTGLDVCRALSLGADFVLLGRAFVYAVAALGERGGHHLVDVLVADIESNLANLGCRSIGDLPAFAPRAA